MPKINNIPIFICMISEICSFFVMNWLRYLLFTILPMRWAHTKIGWSREGVRSTTNGSLSTSLSIFLLIPNYLWCVRVFDLMWFSFALIFIWSEIFLIFFSFAPHQNVQSKNPSNTVDQSKTIDSIETKANEKSIIHLMFFQRHNQFRVGLHLWCRYLIPSFHEAGL